MLDAKTSYAFFQGYDIEVYEQPCLDSRQLEISDQLCLMNWRQFTDRLQIHNDSTLNYKIGVEVTDSFALVSYGDAHLPLITQPSPR